MENPKAPQPTQTAEALTPTTKRCPICQEFDEKTKALLGDLFSTDELTLLSYLLAASIRYQTIMTAKLDRNDMMARLRNRRDIDFASTIIAKLLMGFEKDQLDILLKRIQKDHQVGIRIKHQTCPHEDNLSTTPGVV